MNQDLSGFLSSTCQFSTSQLQKVEPKLNDNGVETLNGLKELSQEELQEIGIPLPLAKKIIESFSKIPPQDNLQLSQFPGQLTQSTIVADISKQGPQEEEVKESSFAKVMMSQIEIEQSFFPVSTEKNQYVLYETFVDSSSEQMMDKIKLNEDEYQRMKSDISFFSEVKCIGLYGKFKECSRIALQFLQAKIEINEKINQLKEGIIVIRHIDRIAFIYKTEEDNYAFDKQKLLSKHAPTYLRYLIDFSEQIYAVTDEDFKFNPDPNSPFKQESNPSLIMSQMTIMQSSINEEAKKSDDEIEVVPLLPIKADQQAIKNLQCFQDSIGYLIECKFKTEQISNNSNSSFKIKIEQNILEFGDWYKKEYIYCTYDHARKIVLQKWPEKLYFFFEKAYPNKFTEQANECIAPFFIGKQREELKKYVDILQKEYNSKYKELKNKHKSEDQDKGKELSTSIIDIFTQSACPKGQKILNQKQWEKFSFENAMNNECSDSCMTMNWLNLCYKQFEIENKTIQLKIQGELQDYSKQSKKVRIHIQYQQSLRSKLSLLNDEYKKYNQEIIKKRDEEFCNIRFEIVNKLIEKSDKLLSKDETEGIKKCEILCQQITLFKDDGKIVSHWQMKNTTKNLGYSFEKYTSQNLELKKLIFCSENFGFALFINYGKEQKSGFFKFEIDKSIKDKIQFLNYLQTYPSDVDFGVDPSSKSLFIYLNSKKNFVIRKYDKSGFQNNDQECDIFGSLVSEIKQATFVPNQDKILILNQDFQLFEYQISERKLRIVQKMKIIEDKNEYFNLQPDDPTDKFQELQSTFDGKFVVLRTTKEFQIYDSYWDVQYSHIIVGNFKFSKVFFQDNQSYLMITTDEITEILLLKLKNETKIIKSEIQSSNKKNKNIGNPIFDQIYHSFKKYGPHSSFIGCPNETQLFFFTPNPQIEKKFLQQYFKQLRMDSLTPSSSVTLIVDPDLSKQAIKFTVSNTLHLQQLLVSRIALHVATIENFTLVPLANGYNISDKIIENLIQNREEDELIKVKSDLIEKIIEMIKFGVYEEPLLNHNSTLYVVSIVGKQSSGKSYVLNRFFGTRFDVSAARCTDGIWMSLSHIKNPDGSTATFVVLDCEGLFSARRNDQEEMKLCLALSAISDLMILNQDLSFNRYLNQLFNSFSRSIGKLKGRQLFKGKFMMLIRDFDGQSYKEAFREVEQNFSNIMNQQKNFITEIFGGKLIIKGLNYFTLPIFDQEIDETRVTNFLSLDSNRWKSGKDFVDNFKITLAQVFADDDSDIDSHKINILGEQLFSQCIENFYNGGEQIFGKTETVYTLKIIEQSSPIIVNQSKIKFSRDKCEDDEDEDEPKSLQESEQYELFSKGSQSYNEDNHNEWVKEYNSFLVQILLQRENLITQHFEKQIETEVYDNKALKESFKIFLYKLKNFFEGYNRNVFLCQKNCRICQRQCTLSQSHKQNCGCQTSHQCNLICSMSQKCQESEFKCVEPFGHDSVHRCQEANHSCSVSCSIKECRYNCSLIVDHDIEIPENERIHSCGNKHPCLEKCEDEGCERTCMFDQQTLHLVHDCGDDICGHECELCERQCIFPNHMHQRLIKQKDHDKLVFKGDNGEGKMLDYHICDQPHMCQASCEKEGICGVDYQVLEKIWENDYSQFNYAYFKPFKSTKFCKIQIEKYDIDHSDTYPEHDCGIKDHRCTDQCPECKSFCSLIVNHEGCHDTNNHRNKENSVFVAEKSQMQTKNTIKFIADGIKREYKVGESCQPENCTSSCIRKGRAHFHIKECQGNQKCNQNGTKSRHSDDKYYPYEDKSFDQWLCENYWNSYGWKPPVSEIALKDIKCCSFYCNARQHTKASIIPLDFNETQANLMFCTNPAWHQGEHIFSCGHQKKGNYEKMDVVFCVDCTGSMDKFIANTITTIQKLIISINHAPNKNHKKNILFGFVGYRDHQDEEKTFLIKTENLTQGEFLMDYIKTQIDAKGGGGDGAEAVMDGLYASIKKISWRPDSAKYIFHICDSPPHGREYGRVKYDHFPDGCPCGITLNHVAQELQKKKISYKLLKYGSYVDKMVSIFEREIQDFEKLEINDAHELIEIINEVIVRDIQNQEFDVLIA